MRILAPRQEPHNNQLSNYKLAFIQSAVPVYRHYETSAATPELLVVPKRGITKD